MLEYTNMPSSNPLVIEISSTAVKFLSITPLKKNGYQVRVAVRAAYDSKGALAETIRKTLAQIAPESTLVGTAVWASTMVLRKIGLPRIKPNEIAGALQLEADKYVPFGLDECTMDFYQFPQDPQGTKTDVMLIASKKDLILDRCKFLEETGLKPAFIDIHPIALTNWYLKQRPESAKGTRVLIHFGDNPGKTQGEDNFLVVMKDGTPWVIRDLGDRLAGGVTEESCGQLAALLTNAMVFYENLAHEKPKEIILSADDSIAAKLSEAFEKSARIPVIRWKSEAGLEFTDAAVKAAFEAAPGAFAVSLGVALRMLES
jgi:hypothetical protein